ncbi:MAG TPA: hypothetical protein VM821_00495, partial [Abditibacteriaceae bacterium]|nr:hypothetical protein [Abditibacteriaceae bacterium]
WHAILQGAFLFAFLSAFSLPAPAQLATSFYNVTGIQTTSLPNAVRVVIQTDGTAYFGGDLRDFINFDVGFQPKSVRSFRLRVLGARARLPAYVAIGQYPVDSAGVSVAPATFEIPFNNTQAPQTVPHVDIELRFFVPVTIRQFSVRSGDPGIRFSETLGANDVEVEPSQDGRSIVVTIYTDRADTRSAARLERSPKSEQKHRLEVSSDGDKNLRLNVLHTPLREVLREVARATGTPFFTSPEVEENDLSLLLPSTTLAGFLETLSRGYGLSVLPRPAGGFLVARGLSSTGTAANGAAQELELQRLPLQHLSADRARALLPDFLLSAVRVDRDNNTLLVSSSPEIGAKLRADLALLDQPRAQIRIDVAAYEFSSSEDADIALAATFSNRNTGARFNSTTGVLALNLGGDQKRQFAASIQALESRGRVTLRAKPFLVVTSGERGSVFLGQTRYVTVFNGSEVNALRLQIGYSLGVTPRANGGNLIALNLNPRLSTVDFVDSRTRLPTLGIREFSSNVDVQDGDSIIVAGLDSDLDFAARQRGALTVNTTRRNKQQTASILLVTAHKVS